MKTRYLSAISVIFIIVTCAWVVLGASIRKRTDDTYVTLGKQVKELWGASQTQTAPEIYYENPLKCTIDPQSTDIKLNLDLEYRRKGLLWYSTYKTDFQSKYTINNPTDKSRIFHIHYTFPATQALYDDFNFIVDGKESKSQIDPNAGITVSTELAPGETKEFQVSYKSQGLDRWSYKFGSDVTRIQNFSLLATINSRNIDFPPGSISPSEKTQTKNGWQLLWKYKNLIAGFDISIEMPQKLNAGPIASRICYFAPLPLFLFFFMLVILSRVRNINIHPLNYFFLAAAFFAFHILFAYLVAHIDIHVAFGVSAAVSLLLVVNYLRLLVNFKFAVKEAGLSQILFLFFLSYAFFYPAFTGLFIVIAAIITLAVVMQITGRVNWEEKLSGQSLPLPTAEDSKVQAEAQDNESAAKGA
ncbi:MAG: inner membrane CreD family protein [Candidatus Xenobiia bacterium LiM19]